MKNNRYLIIAVTALAAFALGVVAQPQLVALSAGGSDLAAIRQATAQYHRLEVALAAGFEPFLDCMSDPQAGGMGYHYVDLSRVDTTIEMLAPEAVLYQRGPNDQMRLVAVEWVVDAAAWDAMYNEPPTLLGRTFPRNDELGVYGLHAWVWRNNPSGMFASWNPNVSCP